MTTIQLPHSDPDLQLARHIGEYLDRNATVEKMPAGDTLWNTIQTYKQERSDRIFDLSSADSNAIWNQIEQKTNTRKNKTPVYKLSSSKTKAIWATAASMLIAALIGFLYYTSLQPQVVASSKQQIETVMLDDGSKVTLRPHSTIFALSGNTHQTNYKLEGEAFFEVISDPDRTFSVEAGNGKIRVLGTSFNVSTWGRETQVYLEEGSIRFENTITNDSVMLNPGETAKIESDNAINTESVPDQTEFTDWLNKELIFKNKTVRYILEELKQEFSFAFSVPDSIKSTSLSGQLSLENPQQSLEDLSLVLDGTFIKIRNNTYKFVPNK